MKIRALKIAAVVLIMAGLFYISTCDITKAQKDDAAAATESASTGRVVIVDMQKIISESKAGEDIQKQLKAAQEKLEKEASEKDETLKGQRDELVNNQAELGKEKFMEKSREFQQDILDARQELNKESIEVKQLASQAVQKLKLEIIKVVSEMATEENYALVITKQNVILAEKEMDITDEVMAKLNKNVKSIKLDAK